MLLRQQNSFGGEGRENLNAAIAQLCSSLRAGMTKPNREEKEAALG